MTQEVGKKQKNSNVSKVQREGGSSHADAGLTVDRHPAGSAGGVDNSHIISPHLRK